MSFNICALSGIATSFPVVSKKTGHVFEKQLIEKYIETTGKCPITHTELNKEDLVEVKGENFSKPRTVSTTSLTGLFKDMQTEFNSLLVESYNLKKDVTNAKNELSHALYQYDASCRVINKLIRERDYIRDQITKYREEIDEQADYEDEGFVGDEYNNMGIYKGLVNRITELTINLIQMRKSREIPGDLPTLEAMSNYKENVFTPFNDEKEIGITCLDVHKFKENMFLFGSNKGSVCISSIDKKKGSTSTSINNLYQNNSHKRAINDIQFYPSENINGYALCCEDTTCSLMISPNNSENVKFIERYRITQHLEGITGISFHPLQEYAIVSSLDSSWSFHNLLKGVCLIKEGTGAELHNIKIHPDGNYINI
jgi:pre-mRNA-processing factor 19